MKKTFSKNEVAVIMALPSESQSLLENAGIQIHYCGIGKINAAFKTTEVILKHKPKLILNLGTAGSPKFKTHSLIECSGYVQRDMDISPLGFAIGETPMDPIKGLIEAQEVVSNYEKGICGTGDSFEIGATKISCDLVDMEAYAIAKSCLKLETAFMAFKYITDGSDKEAHKDWVANLAPAAQALLRVYQEIVK